MRGGTKVNNSCMPQRERATTPQGVARVKRSWAADLSALSSDSAIFGCSLISLIDDFIWRGEGREREEEADRQREKGEAGMQRER